MKRAAMWTLCATLAAPLLWCPNARAADPAGDVVATQRALFEQGNRLYDERRWAEARDKFLEAWKLKRSYDVAANLGDVELMLGEARGAAEHLAYALREFPAGGKPALRQTLAKRFDEARRLVGALRIQASKPGAEVLVDGRSIGYAPIDDEVFVEPGTHQLTARREGYDDATANVEAKAGGAYEVTLTLEPAAAQALAPKESAAAPQRRQETPAATGAAASPPSGLVVSAGIGLTALLAGGGIAFTLASNSKATDADALAAELGRDGGRSACWSGGAPKCSTLHDLNVQSDTFHNLAVAGFVGAGVAGAATLVYALWPRASADARVMPVVGAGAGGVVVGGRF
ncbi:PEGA domain-containing protein [Sorangium sp. So ce1128]